MPRALRTGNLCQILILHGIPTHSATFFETNWLSTVAHYTLHSIKKFVVWGITVKFDSVMGFFLGEIEGFHRISVTKPNEIVIENFVILLWEVARTVFCFSL